MSDSTDSLLWAPVSSVAQSDIFDTLNKPREASSELDKDAFLSLLITQMKYQDPLSPMDDKEFLGQMAQFTALEQMQNLNAAYSKSQAYAMIGKTVYATYPDPLTGDMLEVSGEVSAVTVRNGETYLFVDGYDVPLSAVSMVGDKYEGASNTEVASYVGKYIQALLMDESGNVTDYVEGLVDYVKMNGEQSVLVVGNKEVFPGEIASVSDKPFLLGKTLNVTYADENGETRTIENAAIKNISIKDNKAYLEVDGASVPVEKINYVMEALSYVGQQLTFNSYDGIVDSVTLRNGIPYFNIGGEQLSYLTFMGN